MRVQKFLFSNSFDGAFNFQGDEGAVIQNGAAVSVSLEEMERAVSVGQEQGYASGLEEGYARGQADARESIEKAAQEALDIFSKELNILSTQTRERSQRVVRDVVMLTRQILQKVFPLLESRLSIDHASTLIESILKQETPPFLKVSVHETLRPLLEPKLHNKSVPLVFQQTEPSTPLSHCKIEWQESGVEWAAQEILSKIEILLKGFENICKT